MTLSKQPSDLWGSERRLLPVSLLRSLPVLLAFSFFSSSAVAQHLAVGAAKGTNNHVLYVELGGTGYYYTFNYERLLFSKKKFALFGRAGIEYIPFGNADKLLHFPIGANLTFGEKKHRAEVGLAALFRMDFSPGVGFGEGFYLTDPPTRIFLAPSLGWRFHAKPNEYGESFFLRVTFTPIIGLDVFDDRPYFLPHAGVSVGRTWSNPNRKGK